MHCHKLSVIILSIIFFVVENSALHAKKMEVTDAIEDSEFVHNFNPLQNQHKTRVLIDRYHNTIYSKSREASGARAMLDILQKDGFKISYADQPLDSVLDETEILIVHGLPNNKVKLPSGENLWQSPLSAKEVEAIVRWIDGGGSLFLTLSHFPNGSGARPLLDALGVKFADGYIWHESAPSFNDPDAGRCSHFFGMSPVQGLVNSNHPALIEGLPVNRVDYLCGAAIFRKQEDVILRFPKGSQNHAQGTVSPDSHSFFEESDNYAGLIGFNYGKGRVVASGDQGMFRNFIFTFDTKEKVYVTISNPENDNANLFVNLMRWLIPKK
ncbi:DUF4350 domain-containing protein [Parasphingorhabdus cellanae]|uniref:DUF4350 domain-containing protein n=1 Tax=Parasphingorhabdus cellanae TaxID=2806553 RepID=A0ABX7T8Q9_9SPHN|nr:DUF4350 domain-containing protein [Parasphingorhabdus cellanae]QTD57303.1 DUF4350 domain-containing protein [Parasphingorhabdus cellanae]